MLQPVGFVPMQQQQQPTPPSTLAQSSPESRGRTRAIRQQIVRPVHEHAASTPTIVSLLSSDEDSDSAQPRARRPSKRPRHSLHPPSPPPSYRHHHDHNGHNDLNDLNDRGGSLGVHHPEMPVPLPVKQAVDGVDGAVVSDTRGTVVDRGGYGHGKSWKIDLTYKTGGPLLVPSVVAPGAFPASGSPESEPGSQPRPQSGSQSESHSGSQSESQFGSQSSVPPLGPQSVHQDGAHDEPPRVRIPIKEPQLCPEQAELVDIILSGRNVFYTGSAGCGKSTVLKAFTKRLRDMGSHVDIVAPTGVSALNVGGSTTFVYAGWNLSSLKQPLKEVRRAAHAKYVRKRLRDTDVLVIDEISSE
ncbi:hypothetical protein F5Y14DRAFT_84386 [Nemania sp. NC0429]|nr:hypothetical protein F5Y14DRAFT_84386 [Nemania sp. NC0429]